MNLKSKLQNSKWQIQYGDPKFRKTNKIGKCLRNSVLGGFLGSRIRSWSHNYKIKNDKSTRLEQCAEQSYWCHLRSYLYMFSPDFVEMATVVAGNVSAKLPVLNQCQVRMRGLSLLPGGNSSYHSLSFSLLLSRGASKAKIMSHSQIVLWIFVIYIFVTKFFLSTIFFRNVFPKLFFQYFFFKMILIIIFFPIFLSIFFCAIFFHNFFEKLRFSQIMMAEENLRKYPILIKFAIWGFLIPLITNLPTNFRNSRWRIEYDGQKSKNHPIWMQIAISGFSKLLITNLLSYSWN